jgi:hypothetical protein
VATLLFGQIAVGFNPLAPELGTLLSAFDGFYGASMLFESVFGWHYLGFAAKKFKGRESEKFVTTRETPYFYGFINIFQKFFGDIDQKFLHECKIFKESALFYHFVKTLQDCPPPPFLGGGGGIMILVFVQ